jgi:hypothetical protein
MMDLPLRDVEIRVAEPGGVVRAGSMEVEAYRLRGSSRGRQADDEQCAE